MRVFNVCTQNVIMSEKQVKLELEDQGFFNDSSKLRVCNVIYEQLNSQCNSYVLPQINKTVSHHNLHLDLVQSIQYNLEIVLRLGPSTLSGETV